MDTVCVLACVRLQSTTSIDQHIIWSWKLKDIVFCVMTGLAIMKALSCEGTTASLSFHLIKLYISWY